MMRLFTTTAAAVLLLAACGGNEPAPAAPAGPTPPAEAPAAAAPDATALATPAQADRMGALNLMCGGAAFRVAFEDTRAVVVNDDGSNTELPRDSAAVSEPGVTVYTDGKMSFAKSGGGDTPTVIRFARGRMAWQDCAIAQN